MSAGEALATSAIPDGLTAEEVAAGFTRPLRARVHHTCGGMPTAMQPQQAEDMARDPGSWSTCWCMVCGKRRPAGEFTWPDGSIVGT